MDSRLRYAGLASLLLAACTSVEDCIFDDDTPLAQPRDTADSRAPGDSADTGHTGDSDSPTETGDTGCVPTGNEIPYNGVDEDCDPTTPDDDLDSDGAGVDEDCDDSDPTVGPDAAAECHYRLRADLTLSGSWEGTLGSALLRGDDLDGDGVAELWVGAEEGQNWTGVVHMYSGAQLISGAALTDDDTLASFSGAAEYDRIGRAEAMAWLGDRDGDGARELLLACPSADPGGFSATGEVYLLATAGTSLVGATQLASTAATVRLQGADTADRFGDALGVADLDGDGVDDLLVGSPGNDSASSEAGLIALFPGVSTAGATISVDDASARMTGSYLEGLGRGVLRSAGDVDGDGHEDLMVGSTSASDPAGVGTGVVYLVAGNDVRDGSLAELAFATIAGAGSGDELGTNGRGLGDLDGDGPHEFVLQALKGDVLATNGGGLYLWHGGEQLAGQLDISSAALAWGSETGLARAGEPLRAVDVNADGVLDLLTATPWHSSGGRVSLLDGASWASWGGGELGTDARVWVSTHEADGLGTGLLATDLDAQGELDLLVGAPAADGANGVVVGVLR